MNGLSEISKTLIGRVVDTDPNITATLKRNILQACTEHGEMPMLGSVQEAADILGVHPSTIRRHADRGDLTPVKISPRNVRYDLAAVESLARNGAG